MTDKPVALIGFGPSMSMVHDLPADVPIWTLNAAEDYGFPRIDRLFDMHPLSDIIVWKERWSRLHTELPYPVYTLDAYPDMPSTVRYPLEEVTEKVFDHLYVGGEQAQYFDSSLPYMLALAVLEGHDQIYVYGFELRPNTEYDYQRVGAALLVGWVMGQGVDVHFPENTPFMAKVLYGYEDFQTISKSALESIYLVMKQKHARYAAAFEHDQGERFELFKPLAMATGALRILAHLVQRCDRRSEGLDGAQPGSIPRSEIERTFHDTLAQQFEWLSKLNVAQGQKNDRDMSIAFEKAYKCAGAVHVLKHLTENIDRKGYPLEEFEDPFVEVKN